MQKFWPENINTIYKSHRALLMSLIDDNNFNDVINVAKQLEVIFIELTLEMPEGELKNALIFLNEKVVKFKEAASYKNERIANRALDILDNFYFEKNK